MAVPYAFTVEAMLEHFGTWGDPTPDELFEACCRVGRVPAVGLLRDLFNEGLLTPEAAAANVGNIWSDSEFPDRNIAHHEWRDLFALAGYTVDGKRARRPRKPRTLWRGSVIERRTDWSWTDNREVAENYADPTHYRRPEGVVWQATVEPWRLLARNTERNEHEYVVDTEGLTIAAV